MTAGTLVAGEASAIGRQALLQQLQMKDGPRFGAVVSLVISPASILLHTIECWQNMLVVLEMTAPSEQSPLHALHIYIFLDAASTTL